MSDEASPYLFEDEHLVAKLEAMSADELNVLPFGVIKLDPSHRVVFYSATEARKSGYGDRPVLGLVYFAEVAPCMNGDDFRGRVERQLRVGKLDIEIGHMGDYSDPNRFLRCRVMSAPNEHVWIAHDRVS